MPTAPDDVHVLDQLIAHNSQRIGAVCRRGLSPLEVSAVIRQINEDTVNAHILQHLGRILDILLSGDSEDLLLAARLTAAHKLSAWLDEAERQIAKSRLTIANSHG